MHKQNENINSKKTHFSFSYSKKKYIKKYSETITHTQSKKKEQTVIFDFSYEIRHCITNLL